MLGGGPVGVRPPGGLGAARGEVGDYEEAGGCWVGGRGVDEVDCGIAVDGVGLCVNKQLELIIWMDKKGVN